MNQKVRVRFAPSPTGGLHIGGVRTALYNYLFAKKHNGSFLLRIEDTDQNRYVEGAEAYIIEALNWCGIPFDEGPGKDGGFGPYRQSERMHLYSGYAEMLIAKGHAYYAFDSNEKLDFHRKDHEKKGETFIYNWHNRLKLDNSLSRSEKETKERLTAGEDYVIRFKSPHDEKLILNDIIRGKIEINTNALDDKILFKSDGMPTYHLANIVDDHLMEISHVIRGEEWLPSLALHQLLYNAFEWQAPQFAHLPLIMKPAGKGKLSKRDGGEMGFPVFPLSWETSKGYREEGYFPEAVTNFLALLGWNPGTEQEIFSLTELINAFSLERVHKSAARFDPEKTKWYNQCYLQQKSDGELAQLYLPILQKHLRGHPHPDQSQFRAMAQLTKIVSLIKERAVFIDDFWELSQYFFITPTMYDVTAVSKQWKPDTPELMNQLVSILQNSQDFSALSLENSIKQWISDKGLSYGKIMPPLRLVIVGEMKGPNIFDVLEVIGKAESVSRIKNALEKL